MTSRQISGRPVSTGTGSLSGSPQPLQQRDPISGTGQPTSRDGARDAQDLSRTEGSRGATTEATPRQRLATQLTEFNRLRQSENPAEQEQARRMLGPILTSVRDLQAHLSTTPRELARDYLAIRITCTMTADFLNTHRSRAGSAAFRREGAQLVDFQQAREQAEGSLRTLRQQVLLPSLPADAVIPTTVPTLEQVRNARLAAAISRDLGDREAATADLRRFSQLANRLTPRSLLGSEGQEFLSETLTFAAACQASDPALGRSAFAAAARVCCTMRQRDWAAFQFLAATAEMTDEHMTRYRTFFTRRLERQLSEEGLPREVLNQRALEQGQALLQIRAQGLEIETPAGLLTALRNGGGILSRYAEALNPESRENPTEVLASLATRTPRTLTELMAVRFGTQVRTEAAATERAGDPLQRALTGFDAAPYFRASRLEYALAELTEVAGGDSIPTGADLRRTRAALNSIREARAEIDGHLSDDPQLRAFQLQGLLQTDSQVLAIRQRLGGLYGGSPRDLFGESDAEFAAANRQLEQGVQSSTQSLTQLRQQSVTTAQDATGTLATRIQSYRLANQIDIALGSGNDRVRDLSEWQTLMAQATDSDVSTADRFTDMGTILAGFQQLRQRRYDEQSLNLVDTGWNLADLVPGRRSERLQRGQVVASDPNRIQTSEADLETHMTQARDSILALLPILNPPTDPVSQATNAQYQSELNLLIAARPGTPDAVGTAARILPTLSADGFVVFQNQPSVQLALLDALTAQANQHLAQGHVTIETLRDPASTVRLGSASPRPLSDFIAGAEGNALTFTDAYRGLSVDDRRQVLQQTLHLGRLGEFRTALANETDPIRRHFRTAMLELEQGNPLRGQAEIQTFLHDLRQPGEDHVLRPIADPQLEAMRSVALDMNRRLMGQALDRLAQISGEMEAQRSTNFAGFVDMDFGGNEATIQAMRNLINNPANGFYSLDEMLPVVRAQRIAAAQADFARGIRADAPILLPCGPNVVGLHNIGFLTFQEQSAMQERQQALEAAAYRGMAVSGPGVETRFGAEGLIPIRNSAGIFTAFQAHPEQALTGVPTVRLQPGGTLTFAPHRGASRDRMSVLRVEIPPEGGRVLVESSRTASLERTVFPPSDRPRYILLYQHHGMHGSSHRSGVVQPREPHPRGIETEFDPILSHVFNFESYTSVQSRSQSSDANRQASLDLANQLRTRGGSYTAASRIYEEVMGDGLRQVQLTIPQSELQRIGREVEATRPELRNEIHQRVFQMIARGMPRPTQTQIEAMIDERVRLGIQDAVRSLTYQRMAQQRSQLDPLARQAWDALNDMLDPNSETFNISDARQDRITDFVLENLAMAMLFAPAAGAGSLTRAGGTTLLRTWLGSEGTTIVGEQAALWAARQGVGGLAGRAALWTMGEAATQSGRHIAARALIWGASTAVEGLVFHSTMTGAQATWGYLRDGVWVFPSVSEFALGAGHSILMMGSIGVGNRVWGRVATEIGVNPQQVARMTEASTAARFGRNAVYHTGQLTTELLAMSAVTERPRGQSVGESLGENLLTILHMRAGGHIFNAATGNIVPRFQSHIENQILQSRVQGILTRLRIDPNTAEGRLMTRALNMRMAEGESIDSVSSMVTHDRLETLRRAVRGELNVDPNSQQGQLLTTLLLQTTMATARGPRGMDAAMTDVPGRLGELNRTLRGIAERGGARGEQADQMTQTLVARALEGNHTAESIQTLNASLTLLIEGGGFGTGEEAAQLRVTLLNHALATGQTHEQIADLARHADGLRAQIHNLTNQLYGEGAAATPFGRSVSNHLLLWALSQPGRAEDLPRRLEALGEAMPQVIETIEACNRELGISNSSLEGLQLFHHMLTWAMSGSHSAAEIQQRLQATQREMPGLRADIRQFVSGLHYTEGSEGANRIAAALLLRLRGESGSTSAFNRTELAAYLSSVGDFSRQVDLILATDRGTAFRPYRSVILAQAIETSMTPNALHRLGQELATGRRRLEIAANGEIHTVEDPTVAPVGEITLPQAPAAVVAAVPASTGTQPVREAARHGTGPLSEPAIEAALVRPERAVFFGDQIQEAQAIAQAANLGGNQALLRGLASLVVLTARGGERGFATTAERNQFLTGQLRQAQELARAAGQGENRALLRQLGELVRDTFQGAERGFAPAEGSAIVAQPAEPTGPTLSTQRHLLAQIANASGLIQARSSAGFFRSLLASVESGSLVLSEANLERVRTIFADPRTQAAIEQAHPMQQERVRTALIYDILRGDLRGPADIGNYVQSIVEHPTVFEGYSLGRGGVPARIPSQPMLPMIAESSAGFSILSTFNYLQGPNTLMVGLNPNGRGLVGTWGASRRLLEVWADPGQPSGPLVNTARRTRAALHQAYELAREIQDLSAREPNSPRLEAARSELTQATRTLEAWDSNAIVWGTAFLHGEAIRGAANPAFQRLRLALDPVIVERQSTRGVLEPGRAIGGPINLHSVHQVRDRILLIEAAGPDIGELADAWLDPARSDQGRHPIQVGEVDLVVRSREDITAVAEAAERRILEANIFFASSQPVIERSVEADGTVRLIFQDPDQLASQPVRRYSVRILEQSVHRAERNAAEARFERASRYEADETAIPDLRPPPRPARSEAEQQPTARPPRRAETEAQQRATVRPMRRGPAPQAETQPGITQQVGAQNLRGGNEITAPIGNEGHPAPAEIRDGFLHANLAPETGSTLSLTVSGLQTPEQVAAAGGTLRFHRVGPNQIEVTNLDFEAFTLMRPGQPDVEVRGTLPNSPPARSVEIRPGDRIRFADGREVIFRLVEGRAEPLTPPPGDRAMEVEAIPPTARVPSSGQENLAHAEIRLLELTFPPGYARPDFRHFTLSAEARDIASHLEESGHGPTARAMRQDLQTLESAAHDSPQFEQALQRIGSILRIKYIEGDFSRTPVPFMSDALFLRYADRIREVYSSAEGGTPEESGVRRTHRPRSVATEEPIQATGTEGNNRERPTVRPGQRTEAPGGETAAAPAAPIPPLPETGPIGEAVQRGRRLAAGDSPIARHAQRAMERLAQSREGTTEFRNALTEVETLTEIANTAGLRLPERGHPQHTHALAFQALAIGARDSLGRTEPGSPEFTRGLAAYRRGRDSVARDLVEAHRPAMENVVNFLTEIGAGGPAWTQVQQRHPFLEAPRLAADIQPHGRLKAEADVLAKINRRGWSSLEPMTDFAGTRAVVESYEDVPALLAAIQSRYTIRGERDGEGNLRPVRDRDGMRRLIEGARSGYRAIHIVVEVEGRPVEIQVQTRAMYQWGRIQHGLIYAEVRGSSGGAESTTYTLTGAARRAADAYCQQVAAHLSDIEQGATVGARPSTEAVINSLPADIPADARRSVMAELTRMDELITETQRRFRQPAEGGGAEIIAFPRRPQPAPVETPLADAPLAEAASGPQSSPPPPSTFVSPFPAGAEGATARQAFARALEAQLNGAFGDMMEASDIAAARAYVQAVSRGEEPSAEATSTALEAFGYRTTRRLDDGRQIPGGMIRIPAEEPAATSMFRATVISAEGGNVRLRWRGQEITLRGLEGAAPFQPNQVVVYIPAVAGASGTPFRMTPPASGAQVGEINPMPGATEFTVGRGHGQAYDARMSRHHAIFRRGADGRWSVEDLGSLNGVNVVGPDGRPQRLPSHVPAILQDGAAVQIGEHWYTFRNPMEPGMVIPVGPVRPGVAEPSILAPQAGQTRFGLQAGITVERAGDHWYVVSGETRVRINGQSHSGNTPLREGDLIQVGSQSFRFQSEVPVRTYGQEVASISISQIGHVRVVGSEASVVSGRAGSDGQVELSLASMRVPVTQPPTLTASILRLPREVAERHGFRFNSDGLLAAGSPTLIVVHAAQPAPPPHPAVQVTDQSTTQAVGGGPYRGGNPVQRVELPHPVDQAGSSYMIETSPQPAIIAQLRGPGTEVAHPVATLIHPDGTTYVTFEIPSRSGAPARRVVLRMSTEQARDWGMTRGDRPAQDYVISLRQAAGQASVQQAPPPVAQVQPLEVTADNGQNFQIVPIAARSPGNLGAIADRNLGQYFGLNARLLPASAGQVRIEMQVVERRRLGERPPPQGETIRITLSRTRAEELGLLQANGSLTEVLGLNPGSALPTGTVGYTHHGDGEFTFGREAPSGSADLTVAPEMRMVSRRQAAFRYQNGALSLRALAPEGTWILGSGRWTELTPDMPEMTLQEGDLVAFGRPRDIQTTGSSRSARMVPSGGAEQSDLVVLEVQGGRLVSASDTGLRWTRPGEPVIPQTPRAPVEQPLQQAARIPGLSGETPVSLAVVGVPSPQERGSGSTHSYRVSGPEARDGRQVYRLSLDERGAPGHVPTEIEISSPTALDSSTMEGLLSTGRRNPGVTVSVAYRDRIPLSDMPNGGSQAPLVDFYAVADAEAMGSTSSSGQPSVAIVDPTARTSTSDPIFAIQRQGSGYRLILQGDGVEVRNAQGGSHPTVTGNARAFDLSVGDRVRFGMTELTFDGRSFRMVARMGSDEVSTEARLQIPADSPAAPPPPPVDTNARLHQLRERIATLSSRSSAQEIQNLQREIAAIPRSEGWVRTAAMDELYERLVISGVEVNLSEWIRVNGSQQTHENSVFARLRTLVDRGDVPVERALQMIQRAQDIPAAERIEAVLVFAAFGASQDYDQLARAVDAMRSPGSLEGAIRRLGSRTMHRGMELDLLEVGVRLSQRADRELMLNYFSNVAPPMTALGGPLSQAYEQLQGDPVALYRRLDSYFLLFPPIREAVLQHRAEWDRLANSSRPGDRAALARALADLGSQMLPYSQSYGFDAARAIQMQSAINTLTPHDVATAIDAGGRRRFVELPGVEADDGLRAVQVQRDSASGLFRILRPGDLPLFITREHGDQAGRRIEVGAGDPAILGEVGETVLVELGGQSYRMTLDDSAGSARLLPTVTLHADGSDRSLRFRAGESVLSCGPFSLRIRESRSRPGVFVYGLIVNEPGGLTLPGRHLAAGEEIRLNEGRHIIQIGGRQMVLELPRVAGMFPGWR